MICIVMAHFLGSWEPPSSVFLVRDLPELVSGLRNEGGRTQQNNRLAPMLWLAMNTGTWTWHIDSMEGPQGAGASQLVIPKHFNPLAGMELQGSTVLTTVWSFTPHRFPHWLKNTAPKYIFYSCDILVFFLPDGFFCVVLLSHSFFVSWSFLSS